VKTFKSSFELFQDYTEYSTIQGLIYVFFPYQTRLGKIFWSLVLVVMVGLGIYWCTTAYMAWITQPVLTTVTTTAYPINQVIF